LSGLSLLIAFACRLFENAPRATTGNEIVEARSVERLGVAVCEIHERGGGVFVARSQSHALSAMV
jgi:hypothetical protein